MNEWKALIGRISLFLGASSLEMPSALALFTTVWGSEPTSFQGPTSPISRSQAEGKHAGLGAVCSVNPARIDLTLTPIGSEGESEPPKLPVIDDSKQLHDELVRLVAIVDKGLVPNPILRIAFFLQFVYVTANWTEANKVIMSIVPEQYRPKLGGEEEFLLRMNYPAKSQSVDQVMLNLITKWSADRFQVSSMLVPTGVPPIAGPQSVIQTKIHDFIAASIAFDFNNVPRPPDNSLSGNQQSSLLLEALKQSATSLKHASIKLGGFEVANVLH